MGLHIEMIGCNFVLPFLKNNNLKYLYRRYPPSGAWQRSGFGSGSGRRGGILPNVHCLLSVWELAVQQPN